MKLYFSFANCIIFTVVPFEDYLSHLGRGLCNVISNLCPIPLSFCNKILSIHPSIHLFLSLYLSISLFIWHTPSVEYYVPGSP